MKLERVVTSARMLTLGLSIAMIVVFAAGCSSRQLYDSAQGWQRTECHRMQDPSERSNCLSSTSTAFDEYKRQSEGAKSSK